MSTQTMTEILFAVLDNGAKIIKDELNILYLDALGEMGEIIFHGELELDIPNEKKDLISNELMKLPDFNEIKKEEYRRGMQLAILNGMKDGVQPHHEMTPDAVSIFLGYLVNKVLQYETSDQPFIILDPAVGTGNLLTAVINNTQLRIHGVGAEADETLLKLAYVNSNLQEHSIDLFHQDSIASPLIQNVDVIMTDLPVGYYPNDTIAGKYELAAKHGHSFVHHLLIEQSMNHVKPGGFLFFVVPNFLFETEDSKYLHEYIKKEGLIYSFMQLPKSMFKNDRWGKSILILRKRKEGLKGPKQALLVELPSFSNNTSLSDMLKRISDWFDEQLSENNI